ncbi:MAG: hypothetical protein ACRCT2_10960 [Plesiomonas shigelloides]
MTPEEIGGLKEGFHDMDKRLALLEQKVDQIDKNLQKIADAMGWIAKMLGAGILGAIVTWLLRGGLNT